jgi:protein TonB
MSVQFRAFVFACLMLVAVYGLVYQLLPRDRLMRPVGVDLSLSGGVLLVPAPAPVPAPVPAPAPVPPPMTPVMANGSAVVNPPETRPETPDETPDETPPKAKAPGAGGTATQSNQGLAMMAIDPIHAPRPLYPARARRRQITGHVLAELDVGGDGRVRQVHLIESSPDGVFDKAARDALTRYRFPARGSGFRVRQRIEFQLR